MNKLQSKALSLLIIAIPITFIWLLFYPAFKEKMIQYQLNRNIEIAKSIYDNWLKKLKQAENNYEKSKMDLLRSRIIIWKAHKCAEENRKWNLTDCDNDNIYYKTAWWKEIEMNYHQIYLNWRLNDNNASQEYIKLKWDTYFERAKSLFEKMWRPEQEVNIYYSEAYKNWIKPEVLICIAKADSNLWNQLKTKHNYWNVWNNDRWDRVNYSSLEKWINAILLVAGFHLSGLKNSKELKHWRSWGHL